MMYLGGVPRECDILHPAPRHLAEPAGEAAAERAVEAEEEHAAGGARGKGGRERRRVRNASLLVGGGEVQG